MNPYEPPETPPAAGDREGKWNIWYLILVAPTMLLLAVTFLTLVIAILMGIGAIITALIT